MKFITYGVSQTGTSHIRMGKPCQDAHVIRQLENGWILAAVADGVGSAARSEIGSALAVQKAADFCAECFPVDDHVINLKSMLRTTFNYAYKSIEQTAAKEKQPIEAYDTTLTLILWNGKKLVYGHSGDGGILGLTADGTFRQITTPQKGPDGVSVLPLRAGFRNWAIDSTEEAFVSLLLLTDGMLDIFTPYLLKDTEDGVYHSLASVFMDGIGSVFEGRIGDSTPKMHANDKKPARRLAAREGKNLAERLVSGEVNWQEYESFLRSIYEQRLSPEETEQVLESVRRYQYPLKLLRNVTDDRTVVGVVRADKAANSLAAADYLEPDWAGLQEAWKRRAYPGMYAETAEEVQGVHEPYSAELEREEAGSGETFHRPESKKRIESDLEKNSRRSAEVSAGYTEPKHNRRNRKFSVILVAALFLVTFIIICCGIGRLLFGNKKQEVIQTESETIQTEFIQSESESEETELGQTEFVQSESESEEIGPAQTEFVQKETELTQTEAESESIKKKATEVEPKKSAQNQANSETKESQTESEQNQIASEQGRKIQPQTESETEPITESSIQIVHPVMKNTSTKSSTTG